MSALSLWAIGIGALMLLGCGALVLLPAGARSGLAAFPRSVWLGRAMMAGAMAWVAWLVWEMPLGWFDAYKWLLWPLTPVAIVAIAVFMDELLAVRALGGVLLLIARPLLDAAQWRETPWRYVAIVLAYVFVIKGIVLVLAPYAFRRAVATCMPGDGACRACGIGGVLFGLLLIVLGVVVF